MEFINIIASAAFIAFIAYITVTFIASKMAYLAFIIGIKHINTTYLITKNSFIYDICFYLKFLFISLFVLSIYFF